MLLSLFEHSFSNCTPSSFLLSIANRKNNTKTSNKGTIWRTEESEYQQIVNSEFDIADKDEDDDAVVVPSKMKSVIQGNLVPCSRDIVNLAIIRQKL